MFQKSSASVKISSEKYKFFLQLRLRVFCVHKLLNCFESFKMSPYIEHPEPSEPTQPTFIVNVLVHSWTYFSPFFLFISKVNIRPHGTMQQRLRWPEVIPQRCLRVVTGTLHQPPESMELQMENRVNPRKNFIQRPRNYLLLGDVDRFVHDDPGDRLVAGRCRRRALVGHVVLRVRQEIPHREPTNGCRCTTEADLI